MIPLDILWDRLLRIQSVKLKANFLGNSYYVAEFTDELYGVNFGNDPQNFGEKPGEILVGVGKSASEAVRALYDKITKFNYITDFEWREFRANPLYLHHLIDKCKSSREIIEAYMKLTRGELI